MKYCIALALTLAILATSTVASARRQRDEPPQTDNCPISQSPIPPGMAWVCICDTNGQCRLMLVRV